jgi:hypothetical protein
MCDSAGSTRTAMPPTSKQGNYPSGCITKESGLGVFYRASGCARPGTNGRRESRQGRGSTGKRLMKMEATPVQRQASRRGEGTSGAVGVERRGAEVADGWNGRRSGPVGRAQKKRRPARGGVERKPWSGV